MKKVLAVDMGATSIRGILGYIEEGALVTREVMRMPHNIVDDDGARWEWKKLMDKVEETILGLGEEITSVGIDTWGVDFGLLNGEGDLVRAPLSYRDSHNERGYEKALREMDAWDIFLETGNQVMPINTLFQLIALKEEKEEYKQGKEILLMPDLFNYMLSGTKTAEESILSTTGIFNLREKRLNRGLLKRFGISEDIFSAPIVKAGTLVGSTRNSRREALRRLDVKVISVCGHDTASAALLTEAFKTPQSLFLSCGTWSLLGGFTERAVLTRGAFERSLTNELGYGSRNMFFKNITGLYLLEKFRKQMGERLGTPPSFEEITAYVEQDAGRYGTIDMDKPCFGEEGMDAKAAVRAFLERKGTLCPSEDMGYFKVIYESLVEKYVETIQAIKEETGEFYNAVHIIGGGAKSPLICRMLADRTGLPVKAGPFEAAAIGNIVVQLAAIGEVKTVEEGIEAAFRSCETRQYKPVKRK